MSGLPRDLIYIGAAGSVVALDRVTGGERWRTHLKRGQAVLLIADGDRLYATTNGQAFCLDPSTGTVLWRNPLTGLGFGIASLLGPSGGASSLEAGLEKTVIRSSAAGT